MSTDAILNQNEIVIVTAQATKVNQTETN